MGPRLAEFVSGLPLAVFAIVGSAAVGGGAYMLARRLRLAEWIFLTPPGPPPVGARIRQLVECAEYSAGYGLGALPEAPVCAGDPVLARAARIAAEHPTPDEVDAALDGDFHRWLSACTERDRLIKRLDFALPYAGVFGLVVGLLGVAAILTGWIPAGLPVAILLLGAILAGLAATAIGSVRADRRATIDPAAALDRQLIAAALVEIRRGRTARQIEVSLSGLVPAGERAGVASRARAA